MTRSPVVLVDLFEPYLGAFLERGAEQGLGVAIAAASSCSFPTAALGVVAVRGDAEAAPKRIRAIQKALGRAPVVAVVRELSIDAVVELLRTGVADVIGLPAPPGDVVSRALLRAPDRGDCELIGQSPAMQQLRAEIAAIAPMRSSVLLTGETGVGKGLVARLIHRASGRPESAFVHVDCSALAPSLIESELFGHERGAFTSAVASRPGRFESAQDGTIFLDEIGELDPSLQVKLLRVLQDRTYERIGAAATRTMTARVIAATNRELRAAVARGHFRADLLFRLNVFRLSIPPLRQRPSDIAELARFGIGRIAGQLGIDPPTLDGSFYERLREHPWPGNTRELMNVLERVLVSHHAGLFDERALERFLADSSSEPGAEVPVSDPIEPLTRHTPAEPERIEAALRAAGGNIARAARRLDVPRSTLRYKIRRHGLAHLIPRD